MTKRQAVLFDREEMIKDRFSEEDLPVQSYELVVRLEVYDGYASPMQMLDDLEESLGWLTPYGGHTGVLGAVIEWEEE